MAAVTVIACVPVPVAHAETDFSLEGAPTPLGMATDHGRDRYWVLTSSSGRLTLRAFSADGTAEGSMNTRDSVENAQALAFLGDDAYVGDVGGRRASVSIWHVPTPWPDTEVLHAARYVLAYPDGPHAAAAILVDADARLFVVTTGDDAAIYRAGDDASPSPVGETRPSPLTRVADAPADDVTDAVVLIDGRWALRTASEVYVLDPSGYQVTAQIPITASQRGQSLTQGLDQAVALTAAGVAGEVTPVELPANPGGEPTATPTRAPGTQHKAEDTTVTGLAAQPGTIIALIAAAVVATLAGVIVLVKR